MGRDTVAVPRQTPRLPGAADLVAKRLAFERTRPDRDWSTSEVARRLGENGFKISQSSVWSIENDPRRKITFAEAMAFAELYDLTLDELTEVPQDITSEQLTEILGEIAAIRGEGRAFDAHLRTLMRKINKFNQESSEELGALFDYLGITSIGAPLTGLKLRLRETGDLAHQLADVLDDEGFVLRFRPPEDEQ